MAEAKDKEAPAKRSHRATYARDKRQGGYMIRVEGPQSNRFAGRTIPVTMRDNSEHEETLTTLVWSGQDQDTGQPVTLYKFEAKPKELDDEIPF